MKNNTFAKTLIEEIKKNNKLPRTKTLSLEDVLSKDENGITLLEYMVKNDIPYLYKFIPGLTQSFEAIQIFYKYNKFRELSNLSNKVYFTKYEDTYFIEKLIEIKEIDEISNLSFEYDFRLFEVFKKHKRLDLLEKIKINQIDLMSQVNENETLIEYLIKNNLINNINIPKFEYESNILEILEKNNRLDLIELIPFTEEVLLKNNLIEKIISLDYIPNLKYSNRKIIEYLYKIDRPDILVNMFLHKEKIDNFFILVSPNETLLEYILKSQNEEINYRHLALNVECIKEDYDYVDAYLMFAKYNKLEYLYSFSSDDLLEIKYKNKCLLDLFIERSPNLTKKMIDFYRLDTNLDIILYLRLKGLKFDVSHGIDFEMLDNEAYAKEYLTKQNEKIKRSIDYTKLKEEEIELLMELEYLLSNEDNKEIIDTIVLSYALQLSDLNEKAFIELKKFIEIIKSNPDFKVRKSNGYSYFNKNEGLNINISNINTINHELGHMFHYYLTEEETPENIEDVMLRIRQDENIKNKINLLSKTLIEQMNKLEHDIGIEYDEWSKKYFNETKTQEIEEFLQMSKESVIEHYISLGYTESELDTILSESFTLEQYKINQKRIKCEEMCDNLLISYYSELVAICDIIDAIYEGEFYHSKLKTDNGEKIKGVFGHGIGYYYSKDIVFQEIIANYSSIIKSDRKEESLAILEAMVGKELLILLDDFYQNKMINSNVYNESYTR